MANRPINSFDNTKKIRLNDKFKDLFDSANRWCVYYGGRSSGKSTSIAIAVITLISNGEAKRVLACRQFKSTIKETVYAQIEDAAVMLGVHDDFEWMTYKVVHKETGAVILFAGLDRNKSNIKGFVNVDVCWIEEAADVTGDSWRFLVPTVIRHNGARFFVSFNPEFESDWVYQSFISSNPYSASVYKIDYTENEYNNQSVLDLAEADRLRDEDSFNHTWLGFCMSNARNAVFPAKWIRSCFTFIEGCSDGGLIAGFDVADEGSDTNALAIRKGCYLKSVEEWNDTSPNSAARYVHGKLVADGVPTVYFDSVGVGAGAKGEFRRLQGNLVARPFNAGLAVRDKEKKDKRSGIKNKDMFANLKAQAYWGLRERMYNTHELVEGLAKPDLNDCVFFSSDMGAIADKMVMELARIKFEYRNGKIAIEKKSESVDSSPNIAECVIMCFFGNEGGSAWLK